MIWSALVGANYASVIDTNYRVNTKYDKSELTPTLSIIYKPIEDLTTYTTYIESLEAEFSLEIHMKMKVKY